MSKAKDISAPRQWKDVVQASITHLICPLNILKIKDTIRSSDLLTFDSLINKVDALDIEFKEHHSVVIDLVGDDEPVLDEEQTVMDDHEHNVAQIIEWLQQVRPEAKAALSAALSMGHLHYLCRWLNDVERNLLLVKGKIDPLITGSSLDTCLLLQLEEQVGCIKLDLSDVTQDILVVTRLMSYYDHWANYALKNGREFA